MVANCTKVMSLSEGLRKIFTRLGEEQKPDTLVTYWNEMLSREK